MIKRYNRSKITKQIFIKNITTSYYFEPFAFVSIPPYYEKYDFWQIIYLPKGSADIIVDNEVRTIKEGQVVFREPNKSSCIVYHQNTPINLAIISFDCSSPTMNVFRDKILTLYGEEASTLRDLIKTGAKLFEPITLNKPQKGSQLKEDIHPISLQFVGVSLERFLIMIYCRLANIPLLANEHAKVNRYIEESKFVKNIKHYLTNNVGMNPTIDEIAAHFNLNATTMMKAFKHETGDSIMNYFCTMKINAAQHMIISSSMNFTQISESLGFSNVNYFSKIFKKRLGMSPTEFSRYETKRQNFDLT